MMDHQASLPPLTPRDGRLDAAVDAGFRVGSKGTHTSITIMFEKLRAVFDATSPKARRPDSAAAIIETNFLPKATATTRQLTNQRGWEPSINDGVCLNIRPFLTTRPLTTACRGALCILRVRSRSSEFNDMGKSDRGKEAVLDQADFPSFWGWPPEVPALATGFADGADFDGNRWNGLHDTKRAARKRYGGEG